MLEPWIIEQIRRREEEQRRRHERPLLEMPVGDEQWPSRNDADDEQPAPEPDEPRRGVVIISM
jgi:hypothetical protein